MRDDSKRKMHMAVNHDDNPQVLFKLADFIDIDVGKHNTWQLTNPKYPPPMLPNPVLTICIPLVRKAEKKKKSSSFSPALPLVQNSLTT